MTSTAYPTVTTAARGTVTLGRTTYDVVELLFSEYVDAITGATRPASSEHHLIGPRGARYLLRGFLYRNGATDTGIRQVISLTSGAPLRVRGNEVRVVVVGDIIEQHNPTA
jgi:hypothetical protein